MEHVSGESTSWWARKFILASCGFLVLWQVGELIGMSRNLGVVLGVYGFVLHMIFGKGYSLIPTYFNRQLRVNWAQPVHLACTGSGTVFLGLAALRSVPPIVGMGGAWLWAGGIGVFLGTILWTIRDNPIGRETGTSNASANRRPVDRVANGFVPIALAYLALGSYETLAVYTGLPVVFDGYFPRIAHVLGAGTGVLLVFALGFRLFPRFLVVTPPRSVVLIVLPAGALAPILLAGSLGHGLVFQIGAVLEAVAVLSFAVTFTWLLYRSDRRRVGFFAVLLGVGFGSVAILLGVLFAFHGITPAFVQAHYRLNLLGFLGLTIVGVAYQFYPPGIGSFRWVSDRTAIVSIIALAGGVFMEATGLILALSEVVLAGQVSGLAGALIYVSLIGNLFYDRYY